MTLPTDLSILLHYVGTVDPEVGPLTVEADRASPSAGLAVPPRASSAVNP
jgi:hypothetical protein